MNTFLAANSAGGFYSLFDEMLQRQDHNILLIKGGPGCGKSSLMKRLADAGEAKGYTVERMHCSSDPQSLDGIWIQEKKLILLDATAPHLADPAFPGAVEQILPLGEYWDRRKLIPHRRSIIQLSEQISSLFKRVYRLLAAAGHLQELTNDLTAPAYDGSKGEVLLQKFFSRLAAVPTGRPPVVQRRFISALSGTGHILFEDGADGYKNVLLIEDSYDSAHRLLQAADERLERLGYDRLQLCCPLHPHKIDHLLVPALSLAVLQQSAQLQWQQLPSVTKTVQMRRLLDADKLAPHKNKLQFMKKLRVSLFDEVCELLASEKTLHDRLEQYYIDAMDFDALNAKAEQLIAELL